MTNNLTTTPTRLYSTLEPMGPILCGACWPDDEGTTEYAHMAEIPDDEARDVDFYCDSCGRRDERAEGGEPCRS